MLVGRIQSTVILRCFRQLLIIESDGCPRPSSFCARILDTPAGDFSLAHVADVQLAVILVQLRLWCELQVEYVVGQKSCQNTGCSTEPSTTLAHPRRLVIWGTTCLRDLHPLHDTPFPPCVPYGFLRPSRLGCLRSDSRPRGGLRKRAWDLDVKARSGGIGFGRESWSEEPFWARSSVSPSINGLP